MTGMAYRIAKWESVFERAESRKLKQLSWIAMPTGFSSSGYQAMIDEFGDDAPSIYGAWCALCNVASSCHIRGVLASSRGNPLTMSHIARMTGFPAFIFERLVAWASRTDIQWLEPVSNEEMSRVLQKNDEKTCENDTSGESPGTPPASQGNSPHTRPDRTEPDKTEQDITRHHRTEPDRTQAGCDSVDWAARWATASKLNSEFVERVREIANRFSRLPVTLERELIWSLSWIAAEFGPDELNEAVDRCAIRGEVRRPKSYLTTIVMNLCDKQGLDWDRLKKIVPQPIFNKSASA